MILGPHMQTNLQLPQFYNYRCVIILWLVRLYVNRILKLVCFLDFFDLRTSSLVNRHEKMARANGKTTQKYAKLIKWPKITFQGLILVSEVAFWRFGGLVFCIEKWS